MSTNPSSTHSKTEYHIIHSSSQYTRSKIRSNNPKINPTIEIKSPYPRAVPSSGDGYPKKKVYAKYSYRQVNTEVNPTSPRVTLGIKKEYKRHTEKKEYEYMNKIPLKEQNNRSINQNHSYYVSKNNNNSDENKAKKYQQRSSYTLKQDRKSTSFSNPRSFRSPFSIVALQYGQYGNVKTSMIPHLQFEHLNVRLESPSIRYCSAIHSPVGFFSASTARSRAVLIITVSSRSSGFSR